MTWRTINENVTLSFVDWAFVKIWSISCCWKLKLLVRGRSCNWTFNLFHIKYLFFLFHSSWAYTVAFGGMRAGSSARTRSLNKRGKLNENWFFTCDTFFYPKNHMCHCCTSSTTSSTSIACCLIMETEKLKTRNNNQENELIEYSVSSSSNQGVEVRNAIIILSFNFFFMNHHNCCDVIESNIDQQSRHSKLESSSLLSRE